MLNSHWVKYDTGEKSINVAIYCYTCFPHFQLNTEKKSLLRQSAENRFSAVNSRKPTDGLQVKPELIGTLRTRDNKTNTKLTN